MCEQNWTVIIIGGGGGGGGAWGDGGASGFLAFTKLAESLPVTVEVGVGGLGFKCIGLEMEVMEVLLDLAL